MYFFSFGVNCSFKYLELLVSRRKNTRQCSFLFCLASTEIRCKSFMECTGVLLFDYGVGSYALHFGRFELQEDMHTKSNSYLLVLNSLTEHAQEPQRIPDEPAAQIHLSAMSL